MSKGLKALKRIRQETCPATYIPDFDKEECCNIIEKELKALEIIKNKPFNNTWFVFYKDYDEYYLECEYADKSKRLTEEEYDLLKEVLLCH